MSEHVVIEFYLYMVDSSRNAEMVTELKRVLDERFKDHYTLKIIDILDEPELAEKHNIFATPTLIKSAPPPAKRFVGDFSNGERVLELMEL
jgi:circadian clock protein KaiB